MSSLTYSYIGVAIAVLCFLVPTYEVWFNNKRNGIARVTKIGWILFVISILVAWVSIGTIHANNKEKENADIKLDSIRRADKKEILDSIRKNRTTVNVSNDTIVYDTSFTKNEKSPLIVLESNPYLKKTGDSFAMVVNLINTGSEAAYNIVDKAAVLTVYNGNTNIYFDRIKGGYVINPDMILAPQKDIIVTYPITGYNKFNFDTLYFCYLVSYGVGDEAKTRKSSRQIFYTLNPIAFNSPLPQIGAIKYNNLAKFLKSQKIW